jgi:hypothetical protein
MTYFDGLQGKPPPNLCEDVAAAMLEAAKTQSVDGVFLTTWGCYEGYDTGSPTSIGQRRPRSARLGKERGPHRSSTSELTATCS